MIFYFQVGMGVFDTKIFFCWAKLCLSLNWRTQPLLASRQGLCGNINDFVSFCNANMYTGKSRSFTISNQLNNSSSMEAGYDSISFPHFPSSKTLKTLTFLRGCFTNFLNSGILKLKCSCCFSIISTGQLNLLRTKSYLCGFWFCWLVYWTFHYTIYQTWVNHRSHAIRSH